MQASGFSCDGQTFARGQFHFAYVIDQLLHLRVCTETDLQLLGSDFLRWIYVVISKSVLGPT